jgi:hypothetical protein
MGLIRVVGVLALLVACDKGEAEPVMVPIPRVELPVFVRLCNDTTRTVNVLKSTFGPASLPAGACMPYVMRPRFWPNVFVDFNVGTDAFSIPSTMWEVPLPGGNMYSFRITILDYQARQAEVHQTRDRAS